MFFILGISTRFVRVINIAFTRTFGFVLCCELGLDFGM